MKTRFLNIFLLMICCSLILGIYKDWAKILETPDKQICGLESVLCPGEPYLPIKLSNPPQIAKFELTEQYSVEDVKKIIAVVAGQEDFDNNLLQEIARCESGWVFNKRGLVDPRDRGTFQINSYHNPTVSDKQADDPWFSTRWVISEIKAGRIWKWELSRHCWGN